MRATQVYDGFIRFEERSAALYLELSVRFFNDIDLSWFWVEMAMEEKQHASLLQYCRETGISASKLPDQAQVRSLKTLFDGLEAKVTAPELSIDDAFAIAIELESSEINDIYKNLTDPIQGPWYVLRKKIDLSIGNHFERLEAAARRFGTSPEIQKRLAALLTKGGPEEVSAS